MLQKLYLTATSPFITTNFSAVQASVTCYITKVRMG